jgi:hypothetical protein
VPTRAACTARSRRTSTRRRSLARSPAREGAPASSGEGRVLRPSLSLGA